MKTNLLGNYNDIHLTIISFYELTNSILIITNINK